eukprot:6085262-Amphidinium_carterae.1
MGVIWFQVPLSSADICLITKPNITGIGGDGRRVSPTHNNSLQIHLYGRGRWNCMTNAPRVSTQALPHLSGNDFSPTGLLLERGAGNSFPPRTRQPINALVSPANESVHGHT